MTVVSFVRVLPRDEPLLQVQAILDLPEDPLPPHAESIRDSLQALSTRKRTQPWSSCEDQRLIGGILRHGLENWQRVAAFVGASRNRAQCSQRWSRGLNPRILKAVWTPEEDKQLADLVAEYGRKNWAKIASILGNRSDVQCRYHFRQVENGETDSEHLELVRKSPLTQSSDMLRATPAPPANLPRTPEPKLRLKEDPPSDEARLSLEQGKEFASTPNFGTRPIAEVVCESPEAVRIPRLPTQTQSWGICGADPHSLNLFLGNFQ
jgi:hypothetical protein